MTASEVAVRTLLAIGIVLLACNVAGWLVGRIGQPRVVGELLAGIALGPSALGLVLPEVVAQLFPEPVIGALRVVAQLGLVLFLLLVGMETALVAIGSSRSGWAVSPPRPSSSRWSSPACWPSGCTRPTARARRWSRSCCSSEPRSR